MTKLPDLLLSVVVPLYNESDVVAPFHDGLVAELDSSLPGGYEIIYIDDGSSDDTPILVREFCKDNSRVKLLQLSRNFGKENALSAGIEAARGRAVLMLDGDGQYPVSAIPEFIAAWKGGAQVVVGRCLNRHSDGYLKRAGSRIFYGIFRRLSGQKLEAGMTDYRLIDRVVADAFLQLPETDRVTRGLIDWLGFRRAYVIYEENRRLGGTPGYSLRDLIKLGANSFVSLTPTPLYIFGCLGVIITIGAFILGGAVLLEQVILGDPWHWKFTGTAMLGIMVLFLVGIVLMSQGILSLYISHIHAQSRRRPLYIVDYGESVGFNMSGNKKEHV
jgi:glycosyltransferase involved in cell wall biosynthesis